MADKPMKLGKKVKSSKPALSSPTATAPRRIVIEVLGDEGDLTLHEIERRVGARLGGSAPPAPIEEFVHELMTVALVTQSSDQRRFRLTDDGRRRYIGFGVLSKG